MKTFLIRSFIFFLAAIAITIALFFFVGSYQTKEAAVSDVAMVKEKLQAKIPEEGIQLSSLSLNDSQKKALEAVQINTETFVLTEAMIICAGGKVGDERISEIVGGSAPSILEISKLIPCLSA